MHHNNNVLIEPDEKTAASANRTSVNVTFGKTGRRLLLLLLSFPAPPLPSILSPSAGNCPRHRVNRSERRQVRSKAAKTYPSRPPKTDPRPASARIRRRRRRRKRRNPIIAMAQPLARSCHARRPNSITRNIIIIIIRCYLLVRPRPLSYKLALGFPCPTLAQCVSLKTDFPVSSHYHFFRPSQTWHSSCVDFDNADRDSWPACGGPLFRTSCPTRVRFSSFLLGISTRH